MTIPEKMSERDGNGKIVLITLASDLNGKMDDARLDYEVVGWSESGANYSLDHGSVGTFIPNQTQRQKDKDDREHWTYHKDAERSVWPEFQKIIERIYETDTGRRMQAFITGVDTGQTYMGSAYNFIENNNSFVIGVKGKDYDKFRKFGIDTPSFRPARERSDLFLIEVNQVKDDLAEFMKLRWNQENEQPSEFMNFPVPTKKKYNYNTFFSHFEGEHRVIEKNKDGDGISARWIKRNSAAQNHLWDCRVYNMALRDIIVKLACDEHKIKGGKWKDYVDIMFGRV